MSVRFIVGSSGQGKTTQIIDEVITRSKEKPEKKILCDRSGAIQSGDAKKNCRRTSATWLF